MIVPSKPPFLHPDDPEFTTNPSLYPRSAYYHYADRIVHPDDPEYLQAAPSYGKRVLFNFKKGEAPIVQSEREHRGKSEEFIEGVFKKRASLCIDEQLKLWNFDIETLIRVCGYSIDDVLRPNGETDYDNLIFYAMRDSKSVDELLKIHTIPGSPQWVYQQRQLFPFKCMNEHLGGMIGTIRDGEEHYSWDCLSRIGKDGKTWGFGFSAMSCRAIAVGNSFVIPDFQDFLYKLFCPLQKVEQILSTRTGNPFRSIVTPDEPVKASTLFDARRFLRTTTVNEIRRMLRAIPQENTFIDDEKIPHMPKRLLKIIEEDTETPAYELKRKPVIEWLHKEAQKMEKDKPKPRILIFDTNWMRYKFSLSGEPRRSYTDVKTEPYYFRLRKQLGFPHLL
jgi:hypothetical protein